MKIEVKQVSKGPGEAEFNILYMGKNIGKIEYKCERGSVDGVAQLYIGQTNGSINTHMLEHSKEYSARKTRTYYVFDETAENNRASIYLGSTKLDKFRRYKSIRFYYKDNILNMHPLDADNKESSIYKNGKPLASIKEASIDYEDLHNYSLDINSDDDEDLDVCIMMLTYLYITSYFKSRKEILVYKFNTFLGSLKKKERK